MENNKGLVILATAAGAFLSGIALGILLAPKSGKENREYIKHNVHEAGDWVSVRSRLARQKAHNKVGNIKENVRKTVSDKFPDLYETTNNFSMSEDDLKGSRS
jgi:gas vesicle protein